MGVVLSQPVGEVRMFINESEARYSVLTDNDRVEVPDTFTIAWLFRQHFSPKSSRRANIKNGFSSGPLALTGQRFAPFFFLVTHRVTLADDKNRGGTQP